MIEPGSSQRQPFYPLLKLIIVSLGLSACSASAFQDTAIERKIANARGGDNIILPADVAGVIEIRGGVYQPAIIIDASAATLTGIVINKADGIIIKGGSIVGPGGRSYGVSIRSSRNVRVENMLITGAHRGVVVNESQDIALVGLNLTGLISDGINVALSQRVLVERNRCRSFRPNIATYDESGKRIKDGDHPDCIQAWSRPTAVPTADIRIIGNDIEGAMQGIFLGNHIRNGVDDGGFDRVTIRDNRIQVSYPNALVLSNVRGANVTKNVITTVAGATLPNRPNRAVQATMRLSGSDINACSNSIAQVDSRAPSVIGTSRCK